MAATIVCVAKRAGVSTATVSRYLGGERVRRSECIVRAIEALNYRPKVAARTLRSGIHYAVAMVVPDITNPYFSALAKGVEAVFRDTSYRLFLANTDESAETESAVLNDVLPRVDGVFLTPAIEQQETPLRMRWNGVSVILVDRELSEICFDSVLVDNANGAKIAARHLVSFGHSAIAMISGPLGNTPGRVRHQSFLEALEEAKIQPPREYLEIADFKESGGYQAMTRLLSLSRPPTAVFCANNVMAVGCLKALAANRVRVPEDISVISFDDLDIGMLLNPPLTVIDRSAEAQGTVAGQLMLRHLRGEKGDALERIVMPVRLIERASCTKPRNGKLINRSGS